jgi:ubiquinone/menaquinone biosynthesis C-methylase UbiE
VLGFRAVVIALSVALLGIAISAQDRPKNTWDERYKTRTPEAIAADFESTTRPVFRYRVAIVGLMELKPGMVAADIGAGSGFLARIMAGQVGPTGKAIATELNPGMVAYMNARAKADGLTNFSALQAQATSTGLDPASVDAVALVETFSFFDRPREMLQSIAASLKPGGLMLIVDLPREGQGASEVGTDADEVVALATAAGFQRLDETTLVPGEYAIRFRKP